MVKSLASCKLCQYYMNSDNFLIVKEKYCVGQWFPHPIISSYLYDFGVSGSWCE